MPTKLYESREGHGKWRLSKAEQERPEAAHVKHSKHKTTDSQKSLKGFLLDCFYRIIFSSLDSTRTFREAPYLSSLFFFPKLQSRHSSTASFRLSSHAALLPQRLPFVRASFATTHPHPVDRT
jgi:hypothetical protein